MHFHKYITIRDTGKHQYQECTICGKRRVKVVYLSGHQPIDQEWVNEKVKQKVVFEIDNAEIVIKIVSGDQIIFYEKVTRDVINIVEEFSSKVIEYPIHKKREEPFETVGIPYPRNPSNL